MLASAVLAMAVVSISTAILACSNQTQTLAGAQQSVLLAEELIERVVSLPYKDAKMTPGPEAGETGPSNYDNMDDYHGYSEKPGAIKDAAGKLYPTEFQGFSRSVTASYGTTTAAGLGTFNCLNVTVTVTDRQGEKTTLSRCIPQPP